MSNLPEHQGVTFHTFPLNSTTRKVWVTNCRIEGHRNITKSVLVCSRHFRRLDFQPLKKDKYFLKNGAVPTIFPWGNLPYQELPASPATVKTEPGEETEEVPGPSKKVEFSDTPIKEEKMSPLKQRSASADQSSAGNAKVKASTRKSLDSATSSNLAKSKLNTSLPAEKSQNLMKSPQKRMDQVSSLVSGSKLEAQDFNGIWHHAKVIEVDHGEQEVLVHFEKNNKSKGPA